jgi:hypothetical protein
MRWLPNRSGRPRVKRRRSKLLLFGALVASVLTLSWAGLASGTQPYETYESTVAGDEPASQFRFNDATGSSTIADSAGTDTATNTGITLGGEGPFGGSKSGAFGESDRATMPTDPLAGTSAFTAEAWVYWGGGTSYGQPVFYLTSGEGMVFGHAKHYMTLTPAATTSGHKLLFEIYSSKALEEPVVFTVGATKLPASTWSYVAVTETSSGTLTLYVNGEIVGETTGATVSPSTWTSESESGEYLGGQGPAATWFKGSLSNVAFYRKALSAEQILAHFKAAKFPVNTVAPTITGTTKDGRVLSAHEGTWTGVTPITFEYQWQRCTEKVCANIGSATESKYTLGHEDVGHTVAVLVKAKNAAGHAEAVSAETAVIEAIKPASTAAPVISGTAKVGQKLEVSNGAWSGSPPTKYKYQWEHCNSAGEKCKAISGAEASSYIVAEEWVSPATTLRATVTAENSAGSASALSAVTSAVTAGPPRNEVAPSITGTPEEGQQLEAHKGTWYGSATIEYSYRWERCTSPTSCTPISGESGPTVTKYTATAEDMGKTIRVAVTASNSVEPVTVNSAAVGPIKATTPQNTELPAISGTAEDEHVLSATTGSWTGPGPITYVYEWLRCNSAGESCHEISGAAAATYTAGHEDVGHKLRVTVIAKNAGGSTSATSAATSVVAASPPSNTALPAISGTAEEGHTLTASSGTWGGTEPLSYTYTWERCLGPNTECIEIAGASTATYTTGSEDVGTTLQVHVVAKNTAGAASATSEATSIVVAVLPEALEPPTISGSAQIGQTLTASPGEWTGQANLDLTYQWESCQALGESCLPIGGATAAQYTPPETEVGATLRVSVSATNDSGAPAVATSATTAQLQSGPSYTSQFVANGPNPEETFSPADVAIDGEQLVVLDPFDGRVELFSESGALESTFASSGSGEGQLKRPTALTVAPGGDIFVLDNGNHRVERFSSSGSYLGETPIESSEAEGVAVDAKGRIWVAATAAHQLAVYNESGERLMTVAPAEGEPGALSRPEHVLITPEGHVLVADWSSNRVDVYNEAGEYLSGFATQEHPDALAVDAQGNIFVTASLAQQIDAYASSGEQFASLGGGETPAGTLRLGPPTGLAVAGATLWGTDSGHRRLVSWHLPGHAPSNSTAPTIAGEAAAGATLTATAGAWTQDPEHFEYQWESCNSLGAECADVVGSHEHQYTPTDAVAGDTIRVTVTAVNGGGTAHAHSSASEAVKAAVAPANTAAPTISGAAYDGANATAAPGTWSGTPVVYSYQWERCDSKGEHCEAIESATNSEYPISDADIFRTLRATVTATNDAGTAHATASPTSVIAPEPPGELTPPTISGTPDVHQVLVGSGGGWYGTERELTYQWEHCNSAGGECAPIPGADETELNLNGEDEGNTVRLRVGAGSDAAALSDVSPATPVIGAAGKLAPSTLPTVSGTAEVGHSLTAATGAWTGNGAISYTYQWQSCDQHEEHCETVAGAEAPTFLPSSGLAGTRLRARITAKDTEGSKTQATIATQPVAASEAPVASEADRVTGTPLVGETLTPAAAESWTGAPTLTYQWVRCPAAEACADISGATEATYTTTSSDLGARIELDTVASNTSGSTINVSQPTPAVAAGALASLTPPVLTGIPAPEGLLAVNQGIWTSLGAVSYSYRWQRCNTSGAECSNISGATEALYDPSSEDVGHTIRAVVSAENTLGKAETGSEVSATIAGGNLTSAEAQAVAEAADPDLVSASSTATLEGEEVHPALTDGEQITATHSLTSSTLSKQAPGELSVNTPAGFLTLAPEESSPSAHAVPTLINGTTALTANLLPATDLLTRPVPLGMTAILQTRSAEAPHKMSWGVHLGADQELTQLANGTAVIQESPPPSSSATPSPEARVSISEEPETSGETTELEHQEAESEAEVHEEAPPSAPTATGTGGEAPSGMPSPSNTKSEYEAGSAAVGYAESHSSANMLVALPAPVAVDAHGHSVPARLEVTGDTLTVVVTPDSETTYPVLTQLRFVAPTDKTSEERDGPEYGLADNRAATFEHFDPNFASGPLHTQTARLTVPWNAAGHAEAKANVEAWLASVEHDGLTPYLTLQKAHEGEAVTVKDYRSGLKAMMKLWDGKVKYWGTWNEPDGNRNRLSATRAEQFWQTAESLNLDVHCGCSIVAGEFSEFSGNPRKYAENYKHDLLHEYCSACWVGDRKDWKKHHLPPIWGIHDYRDLVEDSTSTVAAKAFAGFATPASPQLWVGEAGAELYSNGSTPTRLVTSPEYEEYARQKTAGDTFLKLGEAKAGGEKLSRYKRLYYYQDVAPEEHVVEAKQEHEHRNEFDSGLVEALPQQAAGKINGAAAPKSRGLPRPAYCVLMYALQICPPKIHILWQHAGALGVEVHTFGAEATVEFKYEIEAGGGSKSVLTDERHLHEGYFRIPFDLQDYKKGSCGEVRHWAVVHSAGGREETTPTGPYFCT